MCKAIQREEIKRDYISEIESKQKQQKPTTPYLHIQIHYLDANGWRGCHDALIDRDNLLCSMFRCMQMQQTIRLWRLTCKPKKRRLNRWHVLIVVFLSIRNQWNANVNTFKTHFFLAYSTSSLAFHTSTPIERMRKVQITLNFRFAFY